MPVLYNRYVCVPGVFERTDVSVFVVYVINTVVPKPGRVFLWCRGGGGGGGGNVLTFSGRVSRETPGGQEACHMGREETT